MKSGNSGGLGVGEHLYVYMHMCVYDCNLKEMSILLKNIHTFSVMWAITNMKPKLK